MEGAIPVDIHAGAHLSLSEYNLSTVWKVIVTITTTMSSIIPVDLSMAATNPGYFSNLVTTNKSDPSTIALLSYNNTFRDSVLGENATARRLYNLDWQAFHEVRTRTTHQEHVSRAKYHVFGTISYFATMN